MSHKRVQAPATRHAGKTGAQVPLSGEATSEVVNGLLERRRNFHRFIASRIGNESDAEDVLQDAVVKALRNAATLRRAESAVAWFYRILRNAISDHQRRKASEKQRLSRLWFEAHADEADHVLPPHAWDSVICACFAGLLPALKPRYAEVIRRIDLKGEDKTAVASDLNIKPATLDVVLHRARSALRHRLEVFCGPCSRENCLECFCVK